MQEIQTKAIKTYLENLEYLKDKHKSLYERVTMLSNAIENNEYKERYHLEYIKEDQEFDIYDESTKTYVYNRKPKEFIKDAVKNSNLDKLNSMDLLRPDVYNPIQEYDLEKELRLGVKSSQKVKNDIYNFNKIFNTSTLNKNKKYHHIKKFIFAGILLGTHVQPIVNKLKSILIFLYEYNLEIFRLSLFTTNYAQLSKNRMLLFSIMDDTNSLEVLFEKFLNYEVSSNYMLKYYSSNYNINNLFDNILSVTSRHDPLRFNYAKIIDGIIKPISKNILLYPTLNTKIQHIILKDIPILFIAAGPSFGKNIDWIKRYKEKYFIVAIGAVVIKLIEYDIKPDLIISVDADELILNQFPLKIKDKIKDITFLTSSTTHKDVFDTFNSKNIILFEIMCILKDSSAILDGYSVGEISLKLITLLGGNNIYMLGTDMALDQETGASHTLDHSQLKIITINDNLQESNNFVKNGEFDMTNNTIPVKGNFKDIVLTTLVMHKSINIYNKIIKSIYFTNPKTKIFNLNDGAYFKGAIPLKIKNIIVPKNNKSINIFNKLNLNTFYGLTKKEITFINDSIIEIDKLIEKINLLKKTKLKTIEAFEKERYTLIVYIQTSLINYQKLYTDKIFIKYYLTIEPYLGYNFNKKLNNEANIVKKIKSIWCNQLINLSNLYKQNMNKLYMK